MKRLPRSALALAMLLALVAVATPAGAGITDALKQKALKAVKGDRSKPAAAAESGPVKSRMTTEVTAARLDRFRKGMELEIAEREKAKRFLASLKSKEAYQQCSQQVAMSPEAQKLTTAISEIPENATAEQINAKMTWMAVQLESLVVRRCGPDPGKYDPNQMARDAIGKGSDAAGLGEPGAGLDNDTAYAIWKEWVLEFCNYLEKLKKEPDAAQKIAKMKDEGLRIPGSGTGVFWVYTASEATLLLERCDVLKPLIEATT